MSWKWSEVKKEHTKRHHRWSEVRASLECVLESFFENHVESVVETTQLSSLLSSPLLAYMEASSSLYQRTEKRIFCAIVSPKTSWSRHLFPPSNGIFQHFLLHKLKTKIPYSLTIGHLLRKEKRFLRQQKELEILFRLDYKSNTTRTHQGQIFSPWQGPRTDVSEDEGEAQGGTLFVDIFKYLCMIVWIIFLLNEKDATEGRDIHPCEWLKVRYVRIGGNLLPSKNVSTSN